MKRELVLTDDVAGAACDLIEALSLRTVALSGGETPRPLYELLAARSRLPWEQVDVFFADERCVPPDHAASNYRLAHETLLARVPARVHRMPGETCAAAAYEAEIVSLLGERPALDLALLGIGEDGHTASLFPNDPALAIEDRLVAAVQRPDWPRLTLTLPVLSAAAVALFLVAGASKRGALSRMLADDDIPAARISAARVVVVADRAAGFGLR
jgi:6-phosphogluconolactonase